MLSYFSYFSYFSYGFNVILIVLISDILSNAYKLKYGQLDIGEKHNQGTSYHTLYYTTLQTTK